MSICRGRGSKRQPWTAENDTKTTLTDTTYHTANHAADHAAETADSHGHNVP